MDILWIRMTDGLSRGMGLLNQIEYQTFRKLLSHMMKITSERVETGTFTAEEIVALEKVLKLTTDEVSLVLKTIKHIVKRMTKFIMRPTNLMADLVDILKLEEEKAKLFVNLYKTMIQNTSDDYNISNFGEIDHFNNLSWQLNIELSSSLNKKERSSTVLIDLKSNEHSPSRNNTTEFNLNELQGFYQQIEILQSEVDNILKLE